MSNADLSALGEFGIVDLFRRRAGPLPSGLGIGDDCAVLDDDGPRRTLVTTDMLVEGVHFLRNAMTPWQLGWKSMAVNVSDVAAMGGRPVAAFLSIGLTKDYPRQDLAEFRDGLLACCDAYGTVLAGGDTVSSPQGLVINVALVGSARPDEILYRSGAKPGHIVCVGRTLGASAAGLELVLLPADQRDRIEQDLDSSARDKALTMHLQPDPQVDLGLLLAQTKGVGAAIDLSDGLVADLGHMAKESHVRILLDSKRIPIDPSADAVAKAMGRSALPWALFGGEEYCLIFSVEPDTLKPLQRQAADRLGLDIVPVGRVESGPAQVLVDGKEAGETKGWDHFSSH